MGGHHPAGDEGDLVAALRLMLRRIEERLTRPPGAARPDLLELLAEAMPLDEPRHVESAFWIAFWGQVTTDKRLKRINAWVHREYLRLFERCLAQSWPEWSLWHALAREQVLCSVVTFINGLCASAVANPTDWPPDRQLSQLRLQLQLLRGPGAATTSAPPAQQAASA